MKTSKLLALVMALVVVLSFSLVGCKDKKPDDGGTTPPPEIPKLEYADGTELRMATGYNNLNTGLAFDADTAGEGITLADGVTYHAGDLKPTWVQVQKALNVKITNLFTGAGSAEKIQQGSFSHSACTDRGRRYALVCPGKWGRCGFLGSVRPAPRHRL